MRKAILLEVGDCHLGSSTRLAGKHNAFWCTDICFRIKAIFGLKLIVVISKGLDNAWHCNYFRHNNTTPSLDTKPQLKIIKLSLQGMFTELGMYPAAYSSSPRTSTKMIVPEQFQKLEYKSQNQNEIPQFVVGIFSPFSNPSFTSLKAYSENFSTQSHNI